MRTRLILVYRVLAALSMLVIVFLWTAPGAPPEGADHRDLVFHRAIGTFIVGVFAVIWIVLAAILRRGWGGPRTVRTLAVGALVTGMLGPVVAVAMIASTTPAGLSIMGSWAVLSALSILLALPWSIAEVIVASLIASGTILLLSMPAFLESKDAVDTADTIVNIVLLAAISIGVGCVGAAARRATFARARMAEHVAKVTRDLEIAREVHDSVFPKPTEANGWSFAFSYEPMQQIGGDYAFLKHARGEMIAGLIDVTGHGIASALTVNRLHGEIDRFLGERPDARPDELLAALNRYLHHALAEMSIFATAVCVRTSAASSPGGQGAVEYASAGHPPGMLLRTSVRRDESVRTLDATGPMLGALPPEAYTIGLLRFELSPGDRLFVYTDGILEAQRSGRMLWIDGVKRLIGDLGESATSDALVAAIRAYREGPAKDDVLVMAMNRR